MNFEEAVEAMKRGCHVHRVSQQKRELVGHTDGIPIYECGTEAMRLAAAWALKALTGEPVWVFQGVGSKVLFAPEAEDIEATDWEVVA